MSILRLGPTIVQRQGLEDWLGRFKNVPVRFLIAPPGFGKTTAILGYLYHSATNGLYCAIPPRSSPATIWNIIANALEIERGIHSHEELCHALAARGSVEFALDCDDVPNAEGTAAILRLIADLPEQVSLLIACRSRSAFQVGRLVSGGAAVLCDAERLAFNAAEIRQVAETCCVPFAQVDVLRMLEDSDGWPQVVSCALRKAAEDRCGLGQALKNWRLHHGHLFDEFVAAACALASEGEGNLVLKLMSGAHLDDLIQLQTLEAQGLFVVHTCDGFRPLRPLLKSRLYDRRGRRAALAVWPLQVYVFGSFLAEIDGQSIKWIRRRDRQIFEYVSLQASGRVSRAEIAQMFWPGGDSHCVAQSLRTACSNIRKAIAHIVGFDQVDAYFRVSYDVSINLDNVIVDVNSYRAHTSDGDEQYDRGELRSAHGHYRAAASIYHDDLLIADAREPWVATVDATLRQRHLVVLERIAESA